MAAAFLLAACQPVPPAPQSAVSVMTGLPLFWGEGGPQIVLQGGDQRAAIIRRLGETRKVIPLDRLDAATLARAPLLILAQPRALAGDELVAIDAWVRGGGKVLVFADPTLRWPSRLPIGDHRRAPLVDLLDPLYSHWGIELNLTDTRASEIQNVTLAGAPVAVVSPGRWVATGAACAVAAGGHLADCQIGKGHALLVADADLLDERLWAESGVANDRAILGLLSRLDSR
ncbi:MAG: hypothetical protein RLZZ366_119 [Pseudomonadota bacterium]